MLVLCLPYLASAQQFTFRQYVQQDGLSNLSVTSLLQDRAGYIWVGTENGLFRHDNSDFERFGDAEGIADTAIHSVVEDSAGRLWVGTSHDLYLRQGRRFQPVRPDGHELTVESGSRIAVPAPDRLLVIDKESLLELWTTPGSDVWHRHTYFTPEQLRSVPALAHLSSLYFDSRGRIWLGCGEGICSVDNGRVSMWSAMTGVPKDAWHSWLLDGAGRLWARGLEHVVIQNPGASVFESRDAPHGKLTAGILNVPLIEDQQGRTITRSDMGLMRWQADHWEEFTASNGLTTPEISALLVSRDGAVWLGMSGHGLWRWLGYGTFESWVVTRGLSSNPVWVVLRGADQAITLGTRSGCLQIDANSRAAMPCPWDGLPTGEIQVMAKAADGSLWLGMATGQLLRVAAGQRHAVFITNIPQTRKLFVDSSDRLWICSNNGIHVIPHGSTRVEQTTLPKGLGEIADAAQDHEGTLWFATEGGLLRWSNDEWSLVEVEDPLHAGFASVTPVGDGWLWAGGASHGLMHLHVQGSRADHAQWITDPNVTAAAVYFTQADSRGWLWVGTDDGFVLFDGRSWRKFSQPDGLIWNDTDQNAVFLDGDGSMWIGTSGGLTHVAKPEGLIQTTPLDLRIGVATLGTTELKADTRQSFKWSHGPALDVALQDLDFGERNKTLLAVRLRGLSDDWFQTRDFNMHYPGLAPGAYTFEAVAVDADHQRSSPLVQLSFEILPPWWQTVWFRVVVAILAGAVLAGAWRWSVLKLHARRRALERELAEREALLERATRDVLTKLWNRQAILEILSREIDTARRLSTPLAVALIDIDHFKRINDTLGHLAGDEVLRTLGALLSGKVRSGDALGRYGGEELLLVAPGVPAQRPFLPLERLQRVIAETPFSYHGSAVRVTASFGVAWLASTSDTAEDLLGRADEALYRAKDAGRDRVEYAATGT
jgi:diguanylate cyclase (GGDEF)-like protein